MSNRIERSIVDRVLDMMEDGEVLPWHHCFVTDRGVNSLPFNLVTELPYSGLNVIQLWLASLSHGYSSNAWLSSKGAFSLNGEIDTSTEEGVECVFYSKSYHAKAGGGNAQEGFERTFFTLYNLDQVGYVNYTPEPASNVVQLNGPAWDGGQIVNMVRTVSKCTGLKVYFGADNSRYSIADDTLFVNVRESDREDPYFVSRLARGLIHSTVGEHRTGRLAKCVARRDGTSHRNSGFERLVADIGAAFLGCEFGIPVEPDIQIDDLDRWMLAIENNVDFFTRAVWEAAYATRYLTNEIRGKRKRRLPSQRYGRHDRAAS